MIVDGNIAKKTKRIRVYCQHSIEEINKDTLLKIFPKSEILDMMADVA